MGHGNSNKLYLSHAEHASGNYTAGSSGFQGPKKQTEFQRLPVDCCSLSLQPFVAPVAVIEGDSTANVFDLINIVPYIKKHGSNPVTGRPLAATDLVKLHFFRNTTSNIPSDPVTFKPFTPHTHVVFLRNTGNVFAYESIERLCLKAKSLRDLVNDEPFVRADIITIQDPHNLSGRDLTKFDYVLTGKATSVDKGAGRLDGINVAASGSTAKILRQVAEKNAPPPPPEPIAESSTPRVGVIAPKPVDLTTPYNAAAYSTGRAAASFTSTAEDLVTRSEKALIDEDELMFDEIAAPSKKKDGIKNKAYLRMNTNYGSLNFELHCDKAPKTCYNFVQLAKTGKYDDCMFHRNIPGFMIQGGDPTGTGKGGESIWGIPFRDEYDLKGALKHEQRGTLSMANHGAGTNGSQFFITYRQTCPHLDNKHTVFGGLVGGLDVLDKLERVTSDKKTDRPLRELKIINVEVFQDPFELYKTRLAKRLEARTKSATDDKARERTRLEREAERISWFGEDLDQKRRAEAEAAGIKRKAEDDVLGGVGVGKYLEEARRKAKAAAPPAPATTAGAGPAKKRKGTGGGFGSFDSW